MSQPKLTDAQQEMYDEYRKKKEGHSQFNTDIFPLPGRGTPERADRDIVLKKLRGDAKACRLGTPEELYEEDCRDRAKQTYLQGGAYTDQRQSQKYLNATGNTFNPADMRKICNPNAGLKKLRDVLIQKLRCMAEAQEANKRKGGLCAFSCEEDQVLVKLQKRYKQIMEKQNDCLGKINSTCQFNMPECLKDFDKDQRIIYLQSKLASIDQLNFNFLHKVCDNVLNTNPLATIPENLIKCSGIYEMDCKHFFHDPDLAAIGRQLAGRNQAGSPADRGFAADFYPVGTIVQTKNGYWTNVATAAYDCYADDAAQRDTIRIKWVKSNLLEVAKAATKKDLDQRILARKRSLLGIARQFLNLQSKMYNLQPVMRPMYAGMPTECQKPCLDGHSASAVIDLSIKRAQHNLMVKQNEQYLHDCKDDMNMRSQLCRPNVRRKSKKKKKNKKK